MICEKAYELMSAKLDGALDAAQEEALRAHLEGCPDCKKLMDGMRGLDEKLAGLREPAPEGLKKGVLYRIDQATGKAKPAKRRRFGPGTAIGAVAAVLVLLVGFGVIPLGKQKLLDSMEHNAMSAPTYGPASTVAKGAELQKPQSDLPELLAPESEAASPDVREPVKNVAEQPEQNEAEPNERAPENDGYYYSGGGSDAVRGEANPVSETLRAACAKLSAEEDAAVLLYSEFRSESLLKLLETEEPELCALVEALEPVEEDGQLRYHTDCGTVLALHEWLLENLPQSEQMDLDVQKAETNLRIRMEALDPGSASLYRVITWTPRTHPIAWPSEWPEGWAARLRTEENWALFFPSEDFVPNADAPAVLVFALDDHSDR